MSIINIIDADTFDGVEEQLRDAKTKMLKSLNEASAGRRDEPNEAKKDPESFAVIVNGYSLVSSLSALKIVPHCVRVNKLSVWDSINFWHNLCNISILFFFVVATWRGVAVTRWSQSTKLLYARPG